MFFNEIDERKSFLLRSGNDLFAILISIKFFSSEDKFNTLIDNLSDLITKYDEKIGSLNRNQLLSIMHLPENFEKLKDL